MAYRRTTRPSTLEARRAALQVVRELLQEGGPPCVTVKGIAARLQVGEKWIYTYVGARDELLKAALEDHLKHLLQGLDQVASQPMSRTRRVQSVMDLLVPPTESKAALWLLHFATEAGQGRRGILAQAIGAALAPGVGPYAPAIGGGLLGLLDEALGSWDPSDVVLRKIATDMLMAVVLFRDATDQRSGGGK